MYGVIPVRPSYPGAVLGVLFTHNEGYSTMCGHATVALGRWVVEQGLVPKVEPVTRFTIEAPCGPLALSCAVENGAVTSVTFESVPAFVHALDLAVDVAGIGRVVTDIAYGGAFYAILPAARLGLDFFESPVGTCGGGRCADRRHQGGRTIDHPREPDLGFLYGTIVTDGAPVTRESWNLCVFAERQIDRSPTGSGVTARMALDHARGLIAPGQTRLFRGLSGEPFSGRISRAAQHGPRARCMSRWAAAPSMPGAASSSSSRTTRSGSASNWRGGSATSGAEAPARFRSALFRQRLLADRGQRLAGVIASGSIRTCRIEGLPDATARSKAGANWSVVSTRSPWPPKARA